MKEETITFARSVKDLTYGTIYGVMNSLAFHILLSEIWLMTKNDYIVYCYIILLWAYKHNADWEYLSVLYRLWQYVDVTLYSVKCPWIYSSSCLNVRLK
jgi:hypothetical protein